MPKPVALHAGPHQMIQLELPGPKSIPGRNASKIMDKMMARANMFESYVNQQETLAVKNQRQLSTSTLQAWH